MGGLFLKASGVGDHGRPFGISKALDKFGMVYGVYPAKVWEGHFRRFFVRPPSSEVWMANHVDPNAGLRYLVQFP